MTQASASVLDMTAGGRAMWFDKTDNRAVFVDNRRETYTLCDGRTYQINSDMLADFRQLPFDDNSFHLVVFDPPHLTRLGKNSWLAKKYGRLLPSWHDDIHAGFTEAFRVLRPSGVLIFKWSEVQIPLTTILELSPHPPLFGHTGTNPSTYWMTFIKPDTPSPKEVTV